MCGGRGRQPLAIQSLLRVVGPTGNAQVKRALGCLGRRSRAFYAAVPRIIRLLVNLEADPVFQVPVELRIVVEVHVDSVRVGTVEITRKGPECALEVRWTTGHVIPGIPNFVSSGRIEGQGIAVAIERTVE